MKPKTKKENREHEVLMGLISLYIKSGKPIGSNTLREQGFEALSSATIRNYFSELESAGFLKQPHSSGGRIPTESAFRLYATESMNLPQIDHEAEDKLQALKFIETKNLTTYLHKVAETLSEITGYATFLSSVRFDHDYISHIKLVPIDSSRCLAILLTDFGQILTEELALEKKPSTFTLKRIENYFAWRIKGLSSLEKPKDIPAEEELLAASLYNEIMVRYIVRYSNFSDEEIYKSGLSALLAYPEFSDPLALATGLSLFENITHLRLLLSDCLKGGKLQFWIGSDLAPYAAKTSSCSCIAIPYRIGQMVVGSIGLLGPMRMPYPALFATLQLCESIMSEALTKTFYKYKLSFRMPRSGSSYLDQDEKSIPFKTQYQLLEAKEKP